MINVKKSKYRWFKKKHGSAGNSKNKKDHPAPEITFYFPFIFKFFKHSILIT